MQKYIKIYKNIYISKRYICAGGLASQASLPIFVVHVSPRSPLG